MGEPIQPTAKDRAEARELAAKIIAAVTADAPMPWLGSPMRSWDAGECYRSVTVDEMLTSLAQEVTLLAEQLAEVRAAKEEACDLAEEGWAYAGDYFRDKYNAVASIAALRKVGA